MVDEVITIPELAESLTTAGTDFAVVRQAGIDKKVALSTMKNYFIVPATVSIAGVVQLNNTVNSTSITQAATANAVKVTYDYANSAYVTAQSAINQLAGKANINHTHTAADTVSGVFSTARLPIGNLNDYGIVRHTSSLGNPVGDSANGFVPSLPLVASIASTVNGHTNQFNTLASNGTYYRWDGGATGLNPALGLQSLGAAPLSNPVFTGLPQINGEWLQIGSSASNARFNRYGGLSLNGAAFEQIVASPVSPSTIGRSLLTTVNPNGGTYSFARANVDNTVTYRDINGMRADLGISPANESNSGLVSEATQTEVNAGSAVNKYVSPSKLRSGSGIFGSSNSGGYNSPDWMNGMEERWGVVTVAGNSILPISNLHSTATVSVVVCLGYIANDDAASPKAIPFGNGIQIQNSDGNSKAIRYYTRGY